MRASLRSLRRITQRSTGPRQQRRTRRSVCHRRRRHNCSSPRPEHHRCPPQTKTDRRLLYCCCPPEPHIVLLLNHYSGSYSLQILKHSNTPLLDHINTHEPSRCIAHTLCASRAPLRRRRFRTRLRRLPRRSPTASSARATLVSVLRMMSALADHFDQANVMLPQATTSANQSTLARLVPISRRSYRSW